MIRFKDVAAGREDGHALPGTAALIGAIGAVLLGIGAASDMGWLSVVGGIVLAVGVLGGSVLDHMTVDYDVFARLEKLEK
jgi:uncharacterized membrane protein YebE (DUF533 family)